jgi:uncharacterized membrane protein YeaQ/YmgE (transglycosylase-associated protein family)
VDILLGFLFGAAVGVIAHFALPAGERRGVLLLPVVGAVVSGAVWMLLTWLGWTTENPLLWVLSVVAPAIVVVPTAIVLGRVRDAHDARERARLKLV